MLADSVQTVKSLVLGPTHEQKVVGVVLFFGESCLTLQVAPVGVQLEELLILWIFNH